MSFDPRNYPTWDRLESHPVFGLDKPNIESWSHDPSQYSNLASYGVFLPEWYVHLDPAPSKHDQTATAKRDLANLASACRQIENRFGSFRYELVVLDDFTTYVWVRHESFDIDLFPGTYGEEDRLIMFVDRPCSQENEFRFRSAFQLVETLSQRLSNR